VAQRDGESIAEAGAPRLMQINPCRVRPGDDPLTPTHSEVPP